MRGVAPQAPGLSLRFRCEKGKSGWWGEAKDAALGPALPSLQSAAILPSEQPAQHASNWLSDNGPFCVCPLDVIRHTLKLGSPWIIRYENLGFSWVDAFMG
jgi:hypothetical protein